MSPKNILYMKIIISSVIGLIFLNTNINLMEAVRNNITGAVLATIIGWLTAGVGIGTVWKLDFTSKNEENLEIGEK